MKSRVAKLVATFLLLLSPPLVADAALIDQINQAFREAYGRLPTGSEWTYWAGRINRGEKKSYQELMGAIYFQKGIGGSIAGITTLSASNVATAKSFKVAKNLYPSQINPNYLPDGTLVKSPTDGAIYYLKGGKKSWVLPTIINRWLNENHYFKHDVVITISADDLARYPQTKSVNDIYIGKVLRHPDGTQYFIDDKLRKRKLSASLRAAYKIPAGNLYPATAAHLSEFATGPALTSTTQYPGGMVVYSGAWHGGQIWRIKEAAGGQLMKYLYLSDYIYEADGNPDEGMRAPANAAMLARHTRGSNIERYPDGWVVGLHKNIYVVQGGKLRLIASPEVFAAMGYKQKYVLTNYPEFLRRYPHGYSIGAFKSVVASNAGKGQPAAVPSNTSNLVRVRAQIRTLINNVNDYYLTAYDKEPTVSENKFWVDYIYNGEVNNEADLRAVMQRAAVTGKKPARTSWTAEIGSEKLKGHWFPYLFYFTHQKDPDEADKDYWYGRIDSGDRNTIEKLGGTIQWLKDQEGKTRR
ncbi:MAG TPA: hypothetical protein DDW41_00170 [Candidatus Andersenbacteria bacterium]|nr:hypothetical protein [Candidatus Andersenbacteria bacterium]